MFYESTPRKVQIAVRLTAEEREFVQAVAAEAGITVGRLMRRAIAAETTRLVAERVALAIERELEHAAVSP